VNRPNSLRLGATLLAVAAAAISATAAIAPPSAAAATRGFHIYNWSSYSLRLDRMDGDFSGGNPGLGSVLQPGVGYHDFELTYNFLSPFDAGGATYSILNNDGAVVGTLSSGMHILSVSSNEVSCFVRVGTCTPSTDGTFHGGNTVTYLDQPGSVHNIPPEQSQAQLAALKQFCADNNSATCTFTPTSEAKIESPSHVVGKPVSNTSDVEDETTLTVKDTVGTTDSVGIDVKVGGKILGVVEASITGKYEHEWTEEHTFSQSVTVRLPPHQKCWVEATSPMLRDTGNFTMKLGNTTWNLTGVYFDTPDPNGTDELVIRCADLTASELAAGSSLGPVRTVSFAGPAGGQPSPRVLEGFYTIPRGARIVKPRLHLAIVGPRRVAPGQIVSYRLTVRRSQPKNRPVFSPRNVRIGAAHAGRLVAWMHRALPRREARTRRYRVRVPKAARGRFCIIASAAAKNAHRARDRHCSAVGSKH
jgi:hypothetical protein